MNPSRVLAIVVLAGCLVSIATAACRAGSVIETHYYPGQDHGGAVNASLVDLQPFVKKLLAGQPIAGNWATLAPPPLK